MFNKLMKLGMIAGSVVCIWELAEKCKTINYKEAGRAIKGKFIKLKTKILYKPKMEVES